MCFNGFHFSRKRSINWTYCSITVTCVISSQNPLVQIMADAQHWTRLKWAVQFKKSLFFILCLDWNPISGIIHNNVGCAIPTEPLTIVFSFFILLQLIQTNSKSSLLTVLRLLLMFCKYSERKYSASTWIVYLREIWLSQHFNYFETFFLV